ncbi:hypothetical protein AcW1_002439 [Taiwanofungus camphoratus]|nr:hypothetical protein AcW1_002439 [Antrodia cinnamomea]
MTEGGVYSVVPLPKSSLNRMALLSSRRAYDRTLMEDASSRRESTTAYSSTHHPHWSYETRRRGATYAWEHSRRPSSASYRPPPGYERHPAGSAHHHPHAHHANPFSSPNVQRATGRRTSPLQGGPTEAHRISNESGFWRTVQVIGVVMAIATIGGGLSASAT